MARLTTRFVLVLVTAPNLKTARQLARAALKERLAACVNLIPGLQSHYWWQGKIEAGTEVLLLFKSSPRKLAPLEQCIVALHPYDTPELIVVEVPRGNKRYLEWWANSIAEPRGG